MKRSTTNRMNYFLDNWIPPIIRDSEWFYCNIILKMAVGRKYAKYYKEFKEKVPVIGEDEINEYYRILGPSFIKRETDLNQKCVNRILESVCPKDNVLDAAAGRGYLVRKIKENGCERITALDIVLPEDKYRVKGIEYVEGSLTKLPFEDNSFDIVICTHALEHIKDVDIAISELRRVCRKKIIIVVPRQREYKYTVDLHINFYQYEFDVRKVLGKEIEIELVDHDWYCVETK